MTKHDIIDRIAAGTGLTKIETEAVIDGFLFTVAEALREGGRVDLRGFGSFRVKHRAARTALNPQTRKKMEIEARYVPAFKAAKDLREAVDEAMKAREEA